MTCETCGAKNIYRQSYPEKGAPYCKFCPTKHIPESRIGTGIRAVTGNPNSRRTVAHDHDISRRRLAEDGRTVIRV